MRRIARCCIAVPLLGLTVAACLPWRDYPISPAIEGHITGVRLEGASLRLEVHNQSVPTLGAHRVVAIGPDGRFRIEPIAVRVGTSETAKLYAAFLYLEDDSGSSHIVWRSEWFREFFGTALELDCETQRPSDFGQVCRVVDAASHGWLTRLGQREFLELCASCHGVGAVGGVERANAKMAPDLTRIAARRGGTFDRDELQSWIDGRRRAAAHGVGDMPIWGLRMPYKAGRGPDTEDLTAARIDAIVTYLESVQRPAAPVRDPD